MVIDNNTKEKISLADKKLNELKGYEANDLKFDIDTLINTGEVEVGYRAQAGATHHTQKVYREFIKIIELLKKQGFQINQKPVTHKNAYATNNGGFWNSTVFTIEKNKNVAAKSEVDDGKIQNPVFFSETSLNEKFQVNTPLELSGDGIRKVGENAITTYNKQIYYPLKNYWVTKEALEKIKKEHTTHRHVFERGGTATEMPSSGSDNTTTALVFVPTSKYPLNNLLVKETGHGWNYAWKDITPANIYGWKVYKHEDTGQTIVVFLSNYYASVDENVINEDLTYIKFYYGIKNFIWPNKLTFEHGGTTPITNTKYQITNTMHNIKQHLGADSNYIAEGTIITDNTTNGGEDWLIEDFDANGALVKHLPKSELSTNLGTKTVSYDALKNMYACGQIKFNTIDSDNVALVNMCINAIKNHVNHAINATSLQNSINAFMEAENARMAARQNKLAKANEDLVMDKIKQAARRIKNKKQLAQDVAFAEKFTAEDINKAVCVLELELSELSQGERAPFEAYVNSLKQLAADKSEEFGKGGLTKSRFKLGAALQLIEMAENGKPKQAIKELNEYVKLYKDDYKKDNQSKIFGLPVKDILKEYSDAIVFVKENYLHPKIKNQYEGKTAEQVWEMWSSSQRSHFLTDHDAFKIASMDGILTKKYSDLDNNIQKLITSHLSYGQYGQGGKVSPEVSIIASDWMEAAIFAGLEETDNTYSIYDFTEESQKRIDAMIQKFYELRKKDIEASELPLETIGHDIFYAQQGHGAGFFDHGLPKDVEKRLTDTAKELGEHVIIEEIGDGKLSIFTQRFSEGGTPSSFSKKKVQELFKQIGQDTVTFAETPEHQISGRSQGSFGLITFEVKGQQLELDFESEKTAKMAYGQLSQLLNGQYSLTSNFSANPTCVYVKSLDEPVYKTGGVPDGFFNINKTELQQIKNNFNVSNGDRILEITEKDGSKILGRYIIGSEILFILGKKDNTNPLFAFCAKNEFRGGGAVQAHKKFNIPKFWDGMYQYYGGNKTHSHRFIFDTESKAKEFANDFEKQSGHAKSFDVNVEGNKVVVRKKYSAFAGKKFENGGITFEELASQVAKEYQGKAVAPKYQKLYGKRYNKKEAEEVGNKVAATVKNHK